MREKIQYTWERLLILNFNGLPLRANHENRTHDLQFTKLLLYQLS